MQRRWLLTLGACLLLTASLATPTAVLAEQEIVRNKTLTAAQWTNGVEKSFFVSFSYADCGNINVDLVLTVWYDVLNAQRIHFTKVKSQYWMKGPSTSHLWGGWVEILGNNGQAGHWNADNNQFRAYNPNTVDEDGYSYLGSNSQPMSFNIFGRSAYLEKISNVGSSSCTGDWVYTAIDLHW